MVGHKACGRRTFRPCYEWRDSTLCWITVACVMLKSIQGSPKSQIILLFTLMQFILVSKSVNIALWPKGTKETGEADNQIELFINDKYLQPVKTGKTTTSQTTQNVTTNELMYIISEVH